MYKFHAMIKGSLLLVFVMLSVQARGAIYSVTLHNLSGSQTWANYYEKANCSGSWTLINGNWVPANGTVVISGTDNYNRYQEVCIGWATGNDYHFGCIDTYYSSHGDSYWNGTDILQLTWQTWLCIQNNAASNVLASYSLWDTNGTLVATGSGIVQSNSLSRTATNTLAGPAVYSIAYQAVNGKGLLAGQGQGQEHGNPGNTNHFPPGQSGGTTTQTVYIISTRTSRR